MITLNKKKLFLSVFIFILICFLEFNLLQIYLKDNIREQCSTVFELSNNKNNVMMPAELVFILNPNGKGLINLRGEVKVDNTEYIISRVIKFRYKLSSNHKSVLILSDFNTIKYASDTMDDRLFNSEILDFSYGKTLYMVMQKFHDALILGNPFSPVFMCMKN